MSAPTTFSPTSRAACSAAPAGQPAGLRGAGARGVRRIQHVDVDGHVHRAVTEPAPHPVDGALDAVGLVVVGADDLEAERRVVLEIRRGVERTADPHVLAAFQVEQPLLGGPAERGAVGERGAEVGVPGVQVRVEVQHRDLAVVAVQRRAGSAARWCGRRRG